MSSCGELVFYSVQRADKPRDLLEAVLQWCKADRIWMEPGDRPESPTPQARLNETPPGGMWQGGTGHPSLTGGRPSSDASGLRPDLWEAL